MPAAPEKSEKRGATCLAVGSILLWCASGVCFARGARLLGPMAYLTLMTATGVITVVLLQRFRGRPVSGLLRLPLRVVVAGFWGVAFYTVILALAFGIAPESAIGQVNLLNYLWPLWIALLFREALGPGLFFGRRQVGSGRRQAFSSDSRGWSSRAVRKRFCRHPKARCRSFLPCWAGSSGPVTVFCCGAGGSLSNRGGRHSISPFAR